MKNYKIFNVLAALLMLFGIASCSDRDIIQVENGTGPVMMDLTKENLFLDENFPGNSAISVSWKPATYSNPTEVKYDLEISATENFADKVVLASTQQSKTQVSFTVNQLNEAAKNIGLVPNLAQKMYFRVVSYIGDHVLPQTSAATYLTVKPYLASPTYKYVDLYLIGASTAAGWDNSAGNKELIPLQKTTQNGVYTFTGFFKNGGADGGFKIIRDKGAWDPQYGDGGPGKLSTSGGSGNIKVPADGYYKLTIDTGALTYSLEPIATPTQTFTTISLIGTSTKDKDILLAQSAFDPHLWKASNVDLKAGKFKFRANGSWDVNWGTNAEFFGTGVRNGADIPLSSDWKYDVYFNDATGDYTLIPQKK